MSDVCASLDIGPNALRRWVDQVRNERQSQLVKVTKAITDEQREIQELVIGIRANLVDMLQKTRHQRWSPDAPQRLKCM